MTDHPTPQRVLELKAEAKAMVAAGGIKHAKALLKIANREGYRNWETLIAMAGGPDAVREVKPLTEAQQRRKEKYSNA